MRLTFYLTAELKKEFEVWCVQNDKKLSDVLPSLIEKFLGGGGK